MAAPKTKSRVADEAKDGTGDNDKDESKERAPRPTYDLKPVTAADLPPKAPSRRALLYNDLLIKVRDEYGEDAMVEIAQFNSPTGASMTATSLRNGTKTIPGDVDEWTFIAAKIDQDNGERHSRLYVIYKATEETLKAVQAAGYRTSGNETDEEEEEVEEA